MLKDDNKDNFISNLLSPIVKNKDVFKDPRFFIICLLLLIYLIIRALDSLLQSI